MHANKVSYLQYYWKLAGLGMCQKTKQPHVL